jgi:hypothetical protein
MQTLSDTDVQALLAKYGFAPDLRPGFVGMTKKMKANEMPYMREHVVDGKLLGEWDDVLIEVCIVPQREVSMQAPNTDYNEDPVPFSNYAARGIFMDAGVEPEDADKLTGAA